MGWETSRWSYAGPAGCPASQDLAGIIVCPNSQTWIIRSYIALNEVLPWSFCSRECGLCRTCWPFSEWVTGAGVVVIAGSLALHRRRLFLDGKMKNTLVTQPEGIWLTQCSVLVGHIDRSAGHVQGPARSARLIIHQSKMECRKWTWGHCLAADGIGHHGTVARQGR